APGLAARGNRLPVDSGHEAADARLRSQRLTGGAGGLDRREIPHVERLRRRGRATLLERHLAHERDALLGHRRDQLVVLAVLRALASAVADSGRQAYHGPHGLRRVSPPD